MMDRETIIKGLQIERECVSRDCGRNCGKCDLVQDRDWLLSVYDGAITLLKEQEDIPPVRESDGDPGELVSWWYVCGACRRGMDYHDKFCRWCGRKVKLDGYEL